jgi:hypothetical protein
MNIELTNLGQSKFNKWLAEIGVANLNIQAVAFEALDHLEEEVSGNQTPTYELGQQFTTTGRPEVFKFSNEDYEIES